MVDIYIVESEIVGQRKSFSIEAIDENWFFQMEGTLKECQFRFSTAE